MAENTPNEPLINRDRLALAISIFSILGILSICVTIFIIFRDKVDFEEKAMTIFTTVVALAGSWIGTILAFYFSKENFESATRNVTALVDKMSPQEKLKTVLIKEKMTPKDKMFFVKLPTANVNLIETLSELEKSKRGSRVPVLTEEEKPAFIVHKSSIVEFLFGKSLLSPAPDPKTFTLTHLLDDSEIMKRAENFALAREAGTLADAKAAMDSKTGCQDVFITKGGTKDEPLVGWITNNTIAESAEV